MGFLKEVGETVNSYGDIPLALAFNMCGVKTVNCDVMTKDFQRSEMSLIGGRYAHIHLVKWEDATFLSMLRAFLFGEQTAVCEGDVDLVCGRSLMFGRCIGENIGELTISEDGVLEDSCHPNETRWCRNERGIAFIDCNGRISTQFDRCLSFKTRKWLIGTYTFEQKTHFLRMI